MKQNNIQRILRSLLEEVMASDEPSFFDDQVDFLEKRFFEIEHINCGYADCEPNEPSDELIGVINDCALFLADFDGHQGEEGDLYRRCLALSAKVKLQPTESNLKP